MTMLARQEELAAAIKKQGMHYSLDGMLRNAAVTKTAKFDLGELNKHLRELRDRWLAGDDSVVAEFFALYQLHD